MKEKKYNPLDHIMDVQEASELWGLAPSTIKDLCHNKLEEKGLAIKKGKTWILYRDQENPKKYKD
ncbi:helix-turn-helix domain-containing protein [Paenibacillus enshidis]|uniref:Helix-turn-helix domain-containing protein n=1 Tax=Paenibacillus enshidis TaxID=1458439 RepID=A0ABV5AV77_9BACL